MPRYALPESLPLAAHLTSPCTRGTHAAILRCTPIPHRAPAVRPDPSRSSFSAHLTRPIAAVYFFPEPRRPHQKLLAELCIFGILSGLPGRGSRGKAGGRRGGAGLPPPPPLPASLPRTHTHTRARARTFPPLHSPPMPRVSPWSARQAWRQRTAWRRHALLPHSCARPVPAARRAVRAAESCSATLFRVHSGP